MSEKETKVKLLNAESDNEEIDSEGEDIELESDDELIDDSIGQMINHFFTNEDGDNIAQILTDLKKSLDTHNKLIYKLMSNNTGNKKEK